MTRASRRARPGMPSSILPTLWASNSALRNAQHSARRSGQPITHIKSHFRTRRAVGLPGPQTAQVEQEGKVGGTVPVPPNPPALSGDNPQNALRMMTGALATLRELRAAYAVCSQRTDDAALSQLERYQVISNVPLRSLLHQNGRARRRSRLAGLCGGGLPGRRGPAGRRRPNGASPAAPMPIRRNAVPSASRARSVRAASNSVSGKAVGCVAGVWCACGWRNAPFSVSEPRRWQRRIFSRSRAARRSVSRQRCRSRSARAVRSS